MKKTFLAFDLGASSGRGILGILEDGKLSLEEVHRFENGPVEVEGSLHWDINAIFAEIKTGIKNALAICDNIAGIAVDTWGVDYVLLKENGEFARLPYYYRDSRTDNVPESVFSSIISREELYSKTGLQSMFFNSIFQLVAHKNTHPEDFKNSTLMLMPDAITWFLSGKKACEYTEASTTGLLDAVKRDWDFGIIGKAGIPKDIFPEIVQPCTSAGTLKDELKKELGCGDIPIWHVGSHDTASAVASVPADSDTKWAYISCGTWALVGTENDSPVLTSDAMLANCTNEGGLNGKIRFLTNVNGTWLLQETRRIWKEAGKDISFAEMENMAENAVSGKFTIDPNDSVFMAPGDMPARIREYCAKAGQGHIESDAEIVRCIYDSLALCFREKLEEFMELDKTRFNVLHIVGGGTKDRLLMQLTANSIGIPVLAGPVEATAVGNIIAQGIATGIIASLDEGRHIVKNSFPVEKFLPEL
jgi:rhamnulokinase